MVVWFWFSVCLSNFDCDSVTPLKKSVLFLKKLKLCISISLAHSVYLFSPILCLCVFWCSECVFARAERLLPFLPLLSSNHGPSTRKYQHQQQLLTVCTSSFFFFTTHYLSERRLNSLDQPILLLSPTLRHLVHLRLFFLFASQCR